MMGRARSRLIPLVAVATMLVSCAADGPDGPGAELIEAPPPEPSGTTADLDLDRDAAIAAAIDVRADGCGPRVGFGTGTVIVGDDIVTAAHVVAGADAVEVIDVDGGRAAAEVIVFDPDLDFAVLRPTVAVGTPIELRPAQARRDEAGVLVRIREEDDTVSIEEIDVRVVREANISTTDIYLDGVVVRDGFEIESAVDPGDSGSMIVLPGGGVGIVWARSNRVDGRAWAIDLPPGIIDGTTLTDSLTAVDTGPCIR